MTPYRPAKSIEEARQNSGFQGRFVKLAQNEGAYSLFPRALVAAEKELRDAAHLYPPSGFPALRQAIAERHNLSPDHVLAGPGGTAVLDHLSSAFLASRDEVVIGAPTFGWYAKFAQKMGARVVTTNLKMDGAFDLEALEAAITPQTKFIYVCTPNNPTGAIVDKGSLREFAGRIPSHALLVIDEAYAEYVPSEMASDGARLVADGLRCAVMRTFSKVFGMGGLRLGYLLASPDLLMECQKIQNPYEINRVAIAAGIASLSDPTELDRRSRETCALRQSFTEALTAADLAPIKSHGNFVFIPRNDPKEDARALEAKGFIVRPIDASGWTGLRITIGLEQEMNSLLPVLIQTLHE